MYQIRQLGDIIRNKKNSLIIALLVAVLVIPTVTATVAYLSHSTNEVENSFQPAEEVTCQLEEDVSGGKKNSVKVKNTGETEAYIRVAVIANSVNADGDITGEADVSSYLVGSGWKKSGMYYYYTQPIASGANTGELLKDSIPLDGIQVTVLAEAIQSEPEDAAVDAWGVNPSGL